jgi:hypothetical protein
MSTVYIYPGYEAKRGLLGRGSHACNAVSWQYIELRGGSADTGKASCRQNFPHGEEETAQLKGGKKSPSSTVLTLLSEGIVDIETPSHFVSRRE